MNSSSTRYQKMLRAQQALAWDPEHDLSWNELDTSKLLVRVDQDIAATLNLTATEQVTLSQLLGLMAVQTISQHENVLNCVKAECWEQPLAKKSTASDFLQLGEQFFEEESKHGAAFARYVSLFAERMGISKVSLASILPKFESTSWITRLFLLNCRYSAGAVWWMVMITEEESLELYRRLAAFSQTAAIDPLFYRLNELHYEEEHRHLSYAPMMLRRLRESSSRGARLLSKFDFLVSEALYRVWLVEQFLRLRKVLRTKDSHPFLSGVKAIVKKFEDLSWKHKIAVLKATVFSSDSMFFPKRHRAIQNELRRSGDRARWIA